MTLGLPPDTRRHDKDEEPRTYSKRRKTKHGISACLVTSVPDFDGYQYWRKYGQNQIEGAMYPRSYYRCTWSAEQGCPAKRTVQRNDDGDDIGGSPKYTVVYMAVHTCTANDSMEKPVILETTAVQAAYKKPCGAKNIATPAAFLPPPAVESAAAAESSIPILHAVLKIEPDVSLASGEMKCE